MPRRCATASGSVLTELRLEPTQQSQDDDDDKDEADYSRRPISPSSAMAPGRNDTKQDKNEDNDKDCA